MHIPFRHFVEDPASILKKPAFRVGQQEIGLKGQVGKEAMDENLGMGLLSLGNSRE
jgi:hypothetical protein